MREKVQQVHKLEQQQDQQIRNLKTISKNVRKRWQSRLVEFMQ
jgi:hypothetical protein